MKLTTINGEKFNLPAMLKIAERAKHEMWSGSDRNLIEVFERLVKAVMAERAANPTTVGQEKP